MRDFLDTLYSVLQLNFKKKQCNSFAFLFSGERESS